MAAIEGADQIETHAEVQVLHTERTVREELQATLDSVRILREHLELRDRMNASIHCGPVRWSPITDKANDAENRLAALLQAHGFFAPFEVDKMISGEPPVRVTVNADGSIRRIHKEPA